MFTVSLPVAIHHAIVDSGQSKNPARGMSPGALVPRSAIPVSPHHAVKRRIDRAPHARDRPAQVSPRGTNPGCPPALRADIRAT